ncbi:unnamed protein product [Schistosoma margrebowiei]|uniref:Uncharacterized protein n=1 Tax=Schistosoma margrebowiei TaxID=48269 RepID=A0A183MNA5_9TREM|nr:unnamed protein product [Schistosoma margrebowiei]
MHNKTWPQQQKWAKTRLKKEGREAVRNVEKKQISDLKKVQQQRRTWKPFAVGDLVKCRERKSNIAGRSGSGKLIPKWEGPDDELRQKVISFLDYQTQLVQSYSSTKPAEEDLKEKDETIDLLKKQLDELQTKEEIMKTDVSTYTYIDTRSVPSQYVSEELTVNNRPGNTTNLLTEDSLSLEEQLKSLSSENNSLKTELLSVKYELNNITIKFNQFNDSKKDEINKYETELTNRSTQLSILEGQLKELKLMNKKLTEDSSILKHSKENIQSELKTIKNELDIKQKQYENNIVSQ